MFPEMQGLKTQKLARNLLIFLGHIRVVSTEAQQVSLEQWGTLKANENGNFQDSCSGCSIDGSKYSCNCKPDKDSNEVSSTIDLGQIIGNLDGRLCCGRTQFTCGDGSLYG
ncbi:hypothetical protein BDP55DRAFT_774188 [Colletotrichum godetiae]|uniref:Cyanovirin-N domain-containing protein n=1 Tax=Colletotrichum godetiae TaxID=1209918 RepID=A0AAJ0A619_9PEZI|nr:uncharacterized protein BDP55DRAFT_774188 [Colletotrichum godetiae]KAK1657147.1 hypothetical protein BDP55DRAFT_774188 [Colletotrichum godetiae]